LNPLSLVVGYDRIPGDLRGRVFSVVSSGSFAIMPLGPVLAGVLLDTIGLTMTMFTLGAIALIVSVLPFGFPSWRVVDAPPRSSPDAAAADAATVGETAGRSPATG